MGGTLAGDRNGVHSAADPGLGLPRADRHRLGRVDRRRRQPARRSVDADVAAALSSRSRRRAPPVRARAGAPRRSRQRPVRGPRSTAGREAARDGSNLVPPIIAAVEAMATVGEIADALRAVFGEFEETASGLMLEVSHLTTVFDLPAGPLPAVDDVSFEVGAGRNARAWSANPAAASRSPRCRSCGWSSLPAGSPAAACLQGPPAADAVRARHARVRGAEIALIFQEPMTALNPVFTIGDQIRETLLVHGRVARRDAHAPGDRVARVGPDSRRRLESERLPAPALRRHAAARADRPRPGLPALAGHRRRADDGARRHDSGGDSRPAPGDARRPTTCRCCSSPTISA